MNTYLLLGMKRSGHHALVEWITHNLEKGTTHFNDCNKGWKVGKLIPSNQQSEGGKTITTGEGLHHIYNIEDFNPELFKRHKLGETLNVFKKRVKILLVLRDPMNWIASSLKCGGGPKKNIKERIKIWKIQAKEFLGETHFIVPPKFSSIHYVNYNRWFLDDEYKKQLATELELESWDKGCDVVSPRGGGSSFDALRFKNRASQMKVLERYLKFGNDPEFNKLLDDELLQFNNLIFKWH